MKRTPEIDCLRTLAVWLLIPFHTAMIWCGGNFPLKEGTISRPLEYFTGFVHQWHMPLLFVLSGLGTSLALRKRGTLEYVKERTLRLFVPLVFGTFVVVPPQIYYERVNQGRFEGSFLSFYPHFFEGIYPTGNLSWSHMWFVAYLFVFSLICVHPFQRLKREESQALRRIHHWASRRGGLLLLALPIVLSEVSLRAAFPGLQNLVWDWANFFTYLFLFAAGFLLAQGEGLWKFVDRDRWIFTGVALLLMGAGIALHVVEMAPSIGYHPAWMGFMVLRAFNLWAWVLMCLAWGRRFLRCSPPVLPAITRSTYPFYILHQTVIVVLGFRVMRWDLPLPVRFATIALGSFLLTYLLYDLLVRRTRATRFLFGVKG